MKSSDLKSKVLGMPFGTAANRLRKQIMFCLVVKLGENMCFRCGTPIKTVDELSIEHKRSWQTSDDPVGDFFAPDNIAFSHHLCNIRHGVRPNKKFASRAEKDRFHNKNPARWGGARRNAWRQRRRDAGLPYT